MDQMMQIRCGLFYYYRRGKLCHSIDGVTWELCMLPVSQLVML